MPDVVDRATRSRMMSNIRGRDTAVELLIRSGLHRRGFRFRVSVRTLPGRPDIVLPKYKAVIFINGCFWHGHGCRMFKWPASNPEFWKKKITDNVSRDHRNNVALQNAEWRIATVWECALRGVEKLTPDAVLAQLVTWVTSDELQIELRGEAG